MQCDGNHFWLYKINSSAKLNDFLLTEQINSSLFFWQLQTSDQSLSKLKHILSDSNPGKVRLYWSAILCTRVCTNAIAYMPFHFHFLYDLSFKVMIEVTPGIDFPKVSAILYMKIRSHCNWFSRILCWLLLKTDPLHGFLANYLPF